MPKEVNSPEVHLAHITINTLLFMNLIFSPKDQLFSWGLPHYLRTEKEKVRSGNINSGIRVQESPYRETTPEETVEGDVFSLTQPYK